MKTYKVIFDGYIDNVDLEKMISNEYGHSASLIRSSENNYGNTEATIEFDDNIPYEVIELMTDGNVVVEKLILEDDKKDIDSLKESAGLDMDNMIDSLSNYIKISDMGEILTVIIQAYAENYNLTFEDTISDICKNMNKFNKDAFNVMLRRD